MIDPQSRVVQARVFTVLPDAEGTIPVEEIHEVIALAKKAYHRDAQRIAEGRDWLRFRIGSANRPGEQHSVLTLEAFFDVEFVENHETPEPLPNPNQLAFDFSNGSHQ